jgi:hypothetical protein
MAALSLCFALPAKAVERPERSLKIEGTLPIYLSWQKWSPTSDGLVFSTQARRKTSHKLPQGAHLHLAASNDEGRALREQVLLLPVKTLNGYSPYAMPRRRFMGTGPNNAAANLKAIVPPQTSQLEVRYCEQVDY